MHNTTARRTNGHVVSQLVACAGVEASAACRGFARPMWRHAGCGIPMVIR